MGRHIIDQKTITPGNVGVATQVANPRRASWRTSLQAWLAAAIVANAVVVIIHDALVEAQPQLAPVIGDAYPVVLAAVNAAAVLVGVIAKMVTAVMLNPVVADFIEKYLPALAPARAVAADVAPAVLTDAS